MDEVLCIDTTFNLCEYWLTNTCYENLRLETKQGKNPIFIGPCMIHFERDKFLFNQFISEMCSFQSKIRSLKTIGTDQDKAIYNGFPSQTPELNQLLCVLHLEKGNKSKLLQLNPKKGVIQRILAVSTVVIMVQLRNMDLQIQSKKMILKSVQNRLGASGRLFALVFTNGFPVNKNISFNLASLKVQENRLMCKVFSITTTLNPSISGRKISNVSRRGMSWMYFLR